MVHPLHFLILEGSFELHQPLSSNVPLSHKSTILALIIKVSLNDKGNNYLNWFSSPICPPLKIGSFNISNMDSYLLVEAFHHFVMSFYQLIIKRFSHLSCISPSSNSLDFPIIVLLHKLFQSKTDLHHCLIKDLWSYNYQTSLSLDNLTRCILLPS